jgi:glucose/arabinose dehydrogenase
VICCACCIGAALSIPLAGEPQQPTQATGTGAQPAAPATQPPAVGRGGGRGSIEAQIAAGADFLKRPPVVRLSPESEQKLFLLPEGYRMELVLADPVIEDPVGVSFDGNGRMYVLEMRSYMQDADGTGSRAPLSRISRHEDTDGDGTYDRHTIFADKLVLPRIALPLEDGVLLVLETDNRDLYKYTDTDGDGVSDKRELFYAGYGRVTNMEWQPGGMVWALDNWM